MHLLHVCSVSFLCTFAALKFVTYPCLKYANALFTLNNVSFFENSFTRIAILDPMDMVYTLYISKVKY